MMNKKNPLHCWDFKKQRVISPWCSTVHVESTPKSIQNCVLHGLNPDHEHFDCMGLWILQDEICHGKPLFKHEKQNYCLWWSREDERWRIGFEKDSGSKTCWISTEETSELPTDYSGCWCGFVDGEWKQLPVSQGQMVTEEFAIGTKVIIDGLDSEKFNGELGTISGPYIINSKRFPIKLHSSNFNEQIISVRPQNLKREDLANDENKKQHVLMFPGTHVLVKWIDGFFYKATIQEKTKIGYLVEFTKFGTVQDISLEKIILPNQHMG